MLYEQQQKTMEQYEELRQKLEKTNCDLISLSCMTYEELRQKLRKTTELAIHRWRTCSH